MISRCYQSDTCVRFQADMAVDIWIYERKKTHKKQKPLLNATDVDTSMA